MPTGPSMRENGRMTSSTGRDTSRGLMAANLTDTILTLRKKERACTLGLTETNTWEIGKTILSLEPASTLGVTAGSTLVNGRTTSCTAKVPTNGLMAECTTENIKMIRRMDSVSMFGSTEELNLATGFKESKIMKGFTFYLMEL